MRTLLELYPGDHIALLAANVLVQTTVVMLLAWAVARWVARRGAAARHDVWLCALLGLLLSPAIAYTLDRAGVSIVSLPFLPAEQVEPSPLAEEPAADQEPRIDAIWEPPIAEIEWADTAPILEAPEQAEATPAASQPSASTPLSSADKLRALVGAAAAIWAAGVLMLLARTLHGWQLLARLRREIRPPGTGKLDELAEQVRRTLGIKRLPRIVVAPNVDSPITVGIIRPLLILPKQLTRTLRRDQLRDVLLHECAHVARRDHLVGMLQLVAEMLFWPHPLVHVMNRQLARSREEVCDNYVLRHGDGPRYAQTLLELSRKLVPTTARFAALGLCHPRWRLEDRIGGLLDKRRGTMTRMNVCLRCLTVCVLLTAATVVAGTRIVAAQPKEPPAPNAEETQRDVELPPAADKKESAEETERPTRQIPQVTPTGGLSDEDLSWIYGSYGGGGPETPERRKSLDNLKKKLLASKKSGRTRWGSEKWMKTPEYYAKLDTATLAEEFFARSIFYNELGIYNDPRTGFVYLLVFHDGFAELYNRDDFWKGILHAYDSLSQKLVDPESSPRDIVRLSGHLDEMRFLYGEPKFRRQLKGREKLFLEAHIRVLRRYVWYMDHHDLKKRASFGFWREPWCVAKVALMLTKQVDPGRYARIAPKIDAVRFSKGQHPEELRQYVRLVLSSLTESTEKESAARDKLSKTKSSVRVARPVDADVREQFLKIERIARSSAEEQAKQLPHLYRDLAPRYMNPFVEGIVSSARRNILDPKSIGQGGPYTTGTWADQLVDAAKKKSPAEVADAVASRMWLNIAARARALWVFGRHAEAMDKLLEGDLDSGDKSSVRRAACTIGALKRTSSSGKLLQMYLADDEMSKEVWAPLLFTVDHSDIFQPLLRKVEKDPRLLIRCAGLFQGSLYREPADPMLLKLVSSADKEISYHAARALYECKDAKLAPLAAKFAKDPAPRFRLTATYWAANLPRDAFNSIRQELLPLLADADEKVRFDALRCFARQKDLAAGPVILDLLRREQITEGSRAYEVTVMQALAALTGKQFGYFMHEWGPNRPSNRKAIQQLEAWLRAHSQGVQPEADNEEAKAPSDSATPPAALKPEFQNSGRIPGIPGIPGTRT